MKKVGRVFRVLLALMFATNNLWFASALAAQNKSNLFEAISTEELQNEYGAGGSGGGTGGGTGGGFCSVDIDRDGNCDYRQETTDIQRVGSMAAYQNVRTFSVACNPTVVPVGQSSCSFSVQRELGTNMVVSGGFEYSAPYGLTATIGLDWTPNLSLPLMQDVVVTKGYIDDYAIQKTGTRFYGYYVWRYADYGSTGGIPLTTGYQADSSTQWSKTVWRALYLAKTNSRKWW